MMREVFRKALVMYHNSKAQEVDLGFYARTVDYKRPDLDLADLFSGFLCKEQVKWQTILLLFAVYNMFAAPFAVFVARGAWPSYKLAEILLATFEYAGDTLFILEVLFNFYLPFEEEGVQVNIHTLIRQKYLRGWFTIDVVGALPLDLFFLLAEGNSQETRLLRLNKLVRFFRLNFYWGRMEKNLTDINPSLIRLGKFVFLFFLTAHWIACLWLEVIRLEGWSQASKWVGLNDFNNEVLWSMWDKYFQAYYWALVTMVGYGGTVPHTAIESLFSFIVVSVGVVMYVVVIGTVGSIVLNLDTIENGYRQKIEHINEFFHLRAVPPKLSNKVRSYYDFMWRSRQGIDSVATVNDLPQYLKIEISSFICKDMMAKVPLFEGANEQFFRQLAIVLRPLVCLPNTRVVTKGEMGKEMYFISKGSLEVIIDFPLEDGTLIEKTVCTLKEGQHFGEIALLCRSKRSATIRTREFCDLFMLKAEDFRLLMLANPEMATEMRRHAMEQYPTLEEQLAVAFGETEGDKSAVFQHEDDKEEEEEESYAEMEEQSPPLPPLPPAPPAYFSPSSPIDEGHSQEGAVFTK
eukprot:TRINITY_DN1667_c1_g2_i1.p1 TRINITY_DN1667_c1_g2~~TRINITY_DN1667_c1_g2_i1.p1  ORF type:complete len:576 (+),score=135.60 TRINITY_DN1667_c1_g2_i1:94-1821(+)